MLFKWLSPFEKTWFLFSHQFLLAKCLDFIVQCANSSNDVLMNECTIIKQNWFLMLMFGVCFLWWDNQENQIFSFYLPQWRGFCFSLLSLIYVQFWWSGCINWIVFKLHAKRHNVQNQPTFYRMCSFKPPSFVCSSRERYGLVSDCQATASNPRITRIIPFDYILWSVKFIKTELCFWFAPVASWNYLTSL